ncbi:LytR C-terminal domain-containing protein [Gleimia hominis]|uniref:LytR C-terminal domain-containing protein n=1 Tax=Gleimia hominis TaxID=595468 RepID=A0ABU3I8A6_9ACTO|nr:LytR C-terminal domain-containing protein [Gleimia hominis]MDT3766619.1 LytR C-terminal domain-containing protein [Gleimia hominis]
MTAPSNNTPTPPGKPAPTLTPRQQYRAFREARQSKVFTVIAVVMLAVTLISILVLAGTIRIPFISDFSESTEYVEKSGDVPCPPENAANVKLDGTKAVILNATSRSGLANSVQDALKSYGVKVTDTGNYVGQFYGATQITADADHVAQAYSLARVFPDAKVKFSASPNDKLTILLGENFSDMLPPEQAKTVLQDKNAQISKPENCKLLPGQE